MSSANRQIKPSLSVDQVNSHKSLLYQPFPRIQRLADRLMAMHLRYSRSHLSSKLFTLFRLHICKPVFSPENTHRSSSSQGGTQRFWVLSPYTEMSWPSSIHPSLALLCICVSQLPPILLSSPEPQLQPLNQFINY